MFHDQHVSHKWQVFVILFLFLSFPELSTGIFGVGSFPVPSGVSVITFPAL